MIYFFFLFIGPNIGTKQQNADLEKAGRTKRRKSKASPDQNPRKKIKVSGCEPQKHFEVDSHVRRFKRRLKEHGEGLSSSPSTDTSTGRLILYSIYCCEDFFFF